MGKNPSKPVTGEDIVKWMNEHSYSRGKQVSDVFTEMLDSFIDFMSLDRLVKAKCDIVAVIEGIKEHPYFEVYKMWLEWVQDYQKRESVVDAFNFYEGAVKSKGKADALGQFYTPMPLCDLMGEIVSGSEAERDVETVLDCASGSGRTLLGHYKKNWHKDKVCYYLAGDVDSQSVKMSALNMAINGMFGRSICGDALTLGFRYGYEINEIKYPVPTPFCSIRSLPDIEGADATQKYIYWSGVHQNTMANLEMACRIKRQILNNTAECPNKPQKPPKFDAKENLSTNVPNEEEKPKYGKYEQLTIF